MVHLNLIEEYSLQDDRLFSLVRLGHSGVKVEVMIYGGAKSSCLRPVVILNSIEFPMPPSQEFCSTLLQAGYQVIFVRRAGFGRSTSLPSTLLHVDTIKAGVATTTEAAILTNLLEQMGLRRAILIGLPTANATAYRLTHFSKNLSLSIFANPIIQQNILDVFRPRWFEEMLRQILTSRAGANVATFGFKFQLRRNAASFFRQIMQKSSGDLSYIGSNQSDMIAAGELLQSISSLTVLHDLYMTLAPDQLIKDEYFSGTNAVFLSGEETMEDWQNALTQEAARLSVPVEYAPRGDWFVSYSCPERMIEIFEKYAGKQRSLQNV